MPVVELDGVSKWYGNVIGVNNMTLSIHPGVTGLLGPNGAGKSTLLQLVTGQLRPSQGEVRVLGEPVWSNYRLNQQLGLCPEQDAFYEWMTGWQFVYRLSRLSGLRRACARQAVAEALDLVGMADHAHRQIRGYSKGMRQRIKLAQALVHGPQLLLLDEPFAGTDPLARRDLMDLVIEMGRRGKSVILSSHVLYEVEAVTPNIVVMNRGRLVAQGHVRQIRDLIDKHPHRIVLVCDGYRALAAELIRSDDVVGVEVLKDEKAILVETHSPDAFYDRLPEIALLQADPIREVYSEDDNLEAVFKYLVS